MKIDYQKYHNESGEVAVLYSPSYGAGWSSIASSESMAEAMLFDSRIVEEVLKKPIAKDNIHKSSGPFRIEENEWFEHFTQKLHSWGYLDIYLNGAKNLEIKWVTSGQTFQLECVDGNEQIKLLVMPKLYQA